MNLAEALCESISEFEKDAANILLADDRAAEFWLSELLIEDEGYRAAIQRTLDSICSGSDDSDCYSVWALMKSFDRERQDVVDAARRIVGRIQGRNDFDSDCVSDLAYFKAHLVRFGVKGRYLVQFLSARGIDDGLPQDGDEFSSERRTIIMRVHDMDHEF